MKSFYYYILCCFFILLNSCKPIAFVVKDGDSAYQLKRYSQSSEMLQKSFQTEKEDSKKANIAAEIAQSFQQSEHVQEALDWYKKATALGKAECFFKTGKLDMQLENYEEAMKAFKEFGKLDATSNSKAQREIKNCKNAVEWKNNFSKTRVSNLQDLNSSSSDFSPFLQKGKLFFSSDRKESTGSFLNGWTGEKSADIFYTEVKSGKFTTPQKFTDSVNTDAYEATMVLDNSGQEMYFTRCKTIDDKDLKRIQKNEYCHVYSSLFKNGQWESAEKLNLFSDTVNVGHPAISKDGKILFVSSDAPDGFGGKDLYYFTKSDTGWVGPFNAGNAINTAEDEVFPWLDERNNLYFASSGLPGMGGLDIFKATKGKNIWKDAQNLKSPINSGADDFGYIIEKYKPASTQDSILFAGYFSSSRIGGKGKDDLYKFEEKWVNFFTLICTVKQKYFENPEDPDSKYLGLKPLPDATLEIKNLFNNTLVATLKTDKNGQASIPLLAETDYKITANKKDFFVKNETVSTKGKQNQDSTRLYVFSNLELEKVFTQKEIVIPNIYYDYDKATLRDSSKLVLDSILNFFTENGLLNIEIGSHTDSRGSDEYNQKLSQARAQSVVDYLIEKGIAKERLMAVGFGETKLVNKCANGVDCTEEEHQKNRRTTFRITGSKQVIESIDPDEKK